MFTWQGNGLGSVLALELPRGMGSDPSALGRTTAAHWDNVCRGKLLCEMAHWDPIPVALAACSIPEAFFILDKRGQFELFPSELMLS